MLSDEMQETDFDPFMPKQRHDDVIGPQRREVPRSPVERLVVVLLLHRLMSAATRISVQPQVSVCGVLRG